MIELEKTYLLKKLPVSLETLPYKELIDVYFPASEEHPCLRLRKNGDKYELTKKQPLNENDMSEQKEDTIPLSQKEFTALNTLEGKRVKKKRYVYAYQGKTLEIDVFEDALLGLVLVDAEFSNVQEKEAFDLPPFCLAEVTQETFIAGGMLCGKQYSDIEPHLARFDYQKPY